MTPTVEPCKTLEDAIKRAQVFGLDLYKGVVANVHDGFGYRTKPLLSFAKVNNRARVDPLSGLVLTRNLDDKFYLNYLKICKNQHALCLNYEGKLLKVGDKNPETFRDINTAISSAKDRGFNFYDTILIENGWAAYPNQLGVDLLLTSSNIKGIDPSGKENALLITDNIFI